MTRRVRSGSSQKHKKMPGDATKWGEFDNQYVTETPSKKKKNIELQGNKHKSSPSDSLSGDIQGIESLNESFFHDKHNFSFQTENLGKMSEQANNTYDETNCSAISSDINNHNDNGNFTGNKTNDLKIKKMMTKQNTSDVKYSDEISNKHKNIKLEKNETPLSLKQTGKLADFAEKTSPKELLSEQYEIKKQNKNKVCSNSLSINDETLDSSTETTNIDQVVKSFDKTSDHKKSYGIDGFHEKQKNKKHGKFSCESKHSYNETYKNSPFKESESKKNAYLKKLQERREKLGLLLLPRNVECKLHKIKKRLMEKGFPPETQKEIMRKARRTEELKYRKTTNSTKHCFNCREAGHVLANCPKKSESFKQETGICFKCGSVEHTSYKCPKKIQGFPFANCFICKEQGHISRDCPQNKHGIYPKGGRCNLCGNVNHLRKDCPTLEKRANEEENITLHTINEDVSVDAEVMTREKTKNRTDQKVKIVKF